MIELPPFANEPVLELRRAPVRARLDGGLARLDRRLPLEVPVIVAGDEAAITAEIGSIDPGRPDRLVARAARATPRDVGAAVAAAVAAGAEWAATPVAERAGCLVRAAAAMRERRLELAALALRECGKPWREADADVCEAIDFLEYYARRALVLDAGAELLQLPGEHNALRHAPRGVTAVIAPWNFPLAIPCGMASAALVTGNPVVLKPAEQSPACGLAVYEALRAGGIPAAVLALVPGDGEAGGALVDHPEVATIAFTGSQAVGLAIVRAAAEPHPGQRQIKRVVAELGGKNCVIVDADADLDEAVPEITASAFGYAGQKCSAASRILVHAAVADTLLERLAGAVRALTVGPAEAMATDVPPVIERGAQARITGFAERAAATGRIVATAPAPDGAAGWFCPARLVAGLPPDSEILAEEIFGPLLAVEPVRDVEAAAEIVAGLPVGLTGALFSRNPATVRRFAAASPVGNLYINRGTTGAMVGRQPFGGNRLSGTGAKAGGPGYLHHFVEPRVVTENTMRHGLEM